MAKSTVYFTNELTPEAVVKMYRQLGIELPGKVAVKVHSAQAHRADEEASLERLV